MSILNIDLWECFNIFILKMVLIFTSFHFTGIFLLNTSREHWKITKNSVAKEELSGTYNEMNWISGLSVSCTFYKTEADPGVHVDQIWIHLKTDQITTSNLHHAPNISLFKCLDQLLMQAQSNNKILTKSIIIHMNTFFLKNQQQQNTTDEIREACKATGGWWLDPGKLMSLPLAI